MTQDIDQLDEVKATGENSSTMDPVAPAGGSPKGKNRRADKNAAAYPVDGIEDEANAKKPGGEPFDSTSPAERKGTGKKAPPRRADKTSMKESIEEMFDGQDLTEEFKEKASVVFESAVNAHLAEEVERLEEEFEQRLEEQFEEGMAELIEEVDSYLDFVVEKWLEQNELAVESGIKTEIAESFMEGLYNLFVEHNINVPEESEDILESLEEMNDELQEKLNEMIEANIELNKELTEAKKQDVYDEICEGMTQTAAEKLIALCEGIGSYENIDEFAEKAAIIKENYFGKATGKMLKEEGAGDDIDPIDDIETETYSDPSMNRYTQAISKTIKR